MVVWSIQPVAVWELLQATGVLRGDSRYVYEPFLPAYCWLVEQMEQRIGPPPLPGAFPVWAWYQWGSAQKPRPDLRATGHFNKGEKGVRIECELADERVLLSDFILWHNVLCDGYIPLSEEDNQAFEAEWGDDHPDDPDADRLARAHLRPKIVASWQRIFDLDWEEPSCTSKREAKAIQATFWELRLEDVRRVQEFTAR